MLTINALVVSMFILASYGNQSTSQKGGLNDDLLLSEKLKHVRVDPLIQAAYTCIVNATLADLRKHSFASFAPGALSITNAIVESIPTCQEEAQTLTSTYDRYFGEGEGAEFFLEKLIPLLLQDVNEEIKKSVKQLTQ